MLNEYLHQRHKQRDEELELNVVQKKTEKGIYLPKAGFQLAQVVVKYSNLQTANF